MPFRIKQETGKFAQEWLKGDELGKSLISAKQEVFPNLRPYWAKICPLDIDQANVYLESQLEVEQKGTLSFFGIPVERDLALIACPFALSSLLLFFCLHERHAVNLQLTQEELSYPFALLFQDRVLPWAVAFLTLFAMPVGAELLLIARLGIDNDTGKRFSIVFTSLTAALALWALFELWRIRRQLSSQESLPIERESNISIQDDVDNWFESV